MLYFNVGLIIGVFMGIAVTLKLKAQEKEENEKLGK